MNWGDPMKHLRGRKSYPSGFGNKKPARTVFVLAGSIKYIGFALESSGRSYANRP